MLLLSILKNSSDLYKLINELIQKIPILAIKRQYRPLLSKINNFKCFESLITKIFKLYLGMNQQCQFTSPLFSFKNLVSRVFRSHKLFVTTLIAMFSTSPGKERKGVFCLLVSSFF